MNFLVLVAAVMILTADSNHSGRSSDSRVSAAIEYRTVDRSGNELIVSFGSGDPYFGRYYGRDYFYYDDYRYYRYYPAYRYYPGRHYPYRRTIVVHEPVFIVENRYYDDRGGDDWKSVREHEKGISKAIKEEGKWRKEVSKDWGRSGDSGFSSSNNSRGDDKGGAKNSGKGGDKGGGKSSGKGGGKSKGKGNGKN